MELLVIASIGLAAMFFALWPVMTRGPGKIEALTFSSSSRRDGLLREKEEAVSAVKEIEFDYASGKSGVNQLSDHMVKGLPQGGSLPGEPL